MTRDSPGPSGGGRALPKKPGSPGPAAAMLEEQRRELEKLRAELEEERARGRAERRRFAARTRQLREEAERERQQLADHVRSKWEAQRGRELRQLQAAMLREREAEIRQLLRWKEAEQRQLRQLLSRERDSVVRQARELQRQLAEELVNRGYCGRSGAPDVAAAQCRCRLQEVLSQLRWETDGEQAARIRHLQATLDVERQLFLKYILDHSRWYPALSDPPDSQAVRSSEEARPEAARAARRPPESACGLRSPEGLSPGARIRSGSLDLARAACPSSPEGRTLTRASSFDSLAPARPRWVETTESQPKGSEAENRAPSPDISIPGSPSLAKAGEPRVAEGAEGRPCEALTPLPSDPDYRELVKHNSELAEALQVLARRCSGLRKENSQLRRAGFPHEADEKVKRLKVKNAELTDLARRLEDRARKLQETNLRALSAPLPGQSRASLELCHALARQRARDLEEQAGALRDKDKQIEELRHECHLLQARVTPGLGSALLPGGGVPGARWLSVSDLDRLLRESQREVLRLQKQLTLQQGQGGARAEAGDRSAPCEEARRQVQALERELGARRRECRELGAQTAAARRRGDEAEAQLQAALRDGAWLSEENARLQTQADWVQKATAENGDVRGQLDRACQERDAAGLLAEQLLQEAARGQDRQQQLQRDLQKALLDLQTAREEMRALQCQPGHPPEGAPAATQAPQECQTRGCRSKLQLGPEDQTLWQPGWDKQEKKQEKAETSPCETLEAPGKPDSDPQRPAMVPDSQLPDSRSLAKESSSHSTSSSEVESISATVPSCSAMDTDTASEVDNLGPDNVTPAPDTGDPQPPAAPKLKIFLAQYSYSPSEGPNKQPDSELPLMAGDYVYVFGGMDEDRFYQGELEDGRRGLVASKLVEQIPDSRVLGCLGPKFPDPGPILLPDGQGKATEEDTYCSMSPGRAQGMADSGPGRAARTGSGTQVALETLATEAKPCWPSALQSVGEPSFCRPLVGTEGPLCMVHTQLHLQGVAATWADTSWVPGGRHLPSRVYLDGQEHCLTPAGVGCHTSHGLCPGTRYQARAEPWGCQEATHATLTFTTPLAGPPDPPLDVLVERHPSPGLLVVSWLPVTIDSAGSSNGVQVTGYAVYADGLKVAQVADATAGSTLLEASQLRVPPMSPKVSVRTVSLCGESPDSVPAQIPEDCFACRLLSEPSPSACTRGVCSTCRIHLPACPERLALAPLGAEAGPHAPGSCGEPPTELLEGFPEDPPRRCPPTSCQSSEGECWNSGADGQAHGRPEARAVCREDPVIQKNPQGHQDAGLVPLSPECGPGKEASPRHKRHDQPQPGASWLYLPYSWDLLGEEEEEEEAAACLGPWRRARRSRSRRGQALGGSGARQFAKPSAPPSPAPSSKVVGTCRAGLAWPGKGADAPAARISAALSNVDPPATSAHPEAAEGELAFWKGQLPRVWGAMDPDGSHRGECNGPDDRVPGHPVARGEAGPEQVDSRWQLPAPGHPRPSEAHLGDSSRLASHRGTLPRRPPPWTPETVRTALEKDPRTRQSGAQEKGRQAPRAGNAAMEEGFSCGDSGGPRPAQALDYMPPHEE